MNDFYKKYISLCAKVNKSPSAVAESIGLSRTSPNGWKKGNKPKDTTIEKLATYFDVPSSFFTGDHQQLVTDEITEQNLSKLHKDEQTMLNLYRQMTEDERKLVHTMLKSIVNEREK